MWSLSEFLELETELAFVLLLCGSGGLENDRVAHFEKTGFRSPLRTHSQWEWGALMITGRASSFSLLGSETRAVNPSQFLLCRFSSTKVRPCWSEAPPLPG